MPPPRASAAGGSPVLLRRDGSPNPSDSAQYSSCVLQLQASSQPLQPEQLGLLPCGMLALPGTAALPWMRSSSCGGGGSSGGGCVGASGSCGSAAGSSGGGAALPRSQGLTAVAGLSRLGSSVMLPEQWAAPPMLRCSDTSCVGMPMLGGQQQPLQQQPTGMAAASQEPAASTAACAAAAAPSEGIPASAAVHGPGRAATAAILDATPAQLCSGEGVPATGLLPAPSHGLSGLLWDSVHGGGAEMLLCGAGGAAAAVGTLCRQALQGAASRELLMEAFRDMQEAAEEGQGAAGGGKREREAALGVARTHELKRPKGDAW